MAHWPELLSATWATNGSVFDCGHQDRYLRQFLFRFEERLVALLERQSPRAAPGEEAVRVGGCIIGSRTEQDRRQQQAMEVFDRWLSEVERAASSH